MLDAKKLSEAIRMKRKKVKEDGVDNMIDTAPGPQMNPQDILYAKNEAQWAKTLDLPEKNEAPSDPADPSLDGTQEKSELAKRMARVERILSKLSIG